MSRISKVVNYMSVAEACAMRSHDSETKVGAVLINNKSGAIIATGYNGFVRGAPDSKLPTTRPEKYEYVVHAEQNIVTNCVRNSISVEDATLVCTYSPCKACTRMLWNCGISKVIVKSLYRDFEEVSKMKDIKVSLEKGEEDFKYITYSEVD